MLEQNDKKNILICYFLWLEICYLNSDIRHCTRHHKFGLHQFCSIDRNGFTGSVAGPPRAANVSECQKIFHDFS